jgi:hypothetical protein
MSIDAVFAQFFDNIHDPRQHAKIYYPFYDVANSTSKCNSRLKIRLLSEVRQKPPVAV